MANREPAMRRPQNLTKGDRRLALAFLAGCAAFLISGALALAIESWVLGRSGEQQLSWLLLLFVASSVVAAVALAGLSHCYRAGDHLVFRYGFFVRQVRMDEVVRVLVDARFTLARVTLVMRSGRRIRTVMIDPDLVSLLW